MPGWFIEFAIAMILSGIWVFTLTLIADAMLGLPFGLFAGDDPEIEALRNKLLTPEVLKLRALAAPAVLIIPTLALSLAVTRLAPGSVDSGALRFLWVLTAAMVGVVLYTSVVRLWRLRKKRTDRQQ